MKVEAVELFAGVGGFRIAIEAAGGKVVWSNQWEPGNRAQHASACYEHRFKTGIHSNADISTVDAAEIPRHNLLVGGFPCQDYSVATTKAKGIAGKKGVLWWEIDRIVDAKRPAYLLLENVDRLLRSPTTQRGRDMGVVLACLRDKGYVVEWRAINAADYSFPQKRRRTFIFAAKKSTPWAAHIRRNASRQGYLQRDGFFARGFPARQEPVIIDEPRKVDATLPGTVQETSDSFESHLKSAGVMVDGAVWTKKVEPAKTPIIALGTMLDTNVDARYFVPEETIPRWKYAKGAKSEYRKSKTGFEYHYKEGGIPFPDDLDQPSRTILTSEGGTTPSRAKHIIMDPEQNRLRVLTPSEVERLNTFPEGWTAVDGIPERWRYFFMGNALVVGVVERMVRTLISGPAASVPDLTSVGLPHQR